MHNNIETVVHGGLCLGCGVCKDICRQHCIEIKHEKGIVFPVVVQENCTECGLCLKACGGKGIDFNKKSHELFSHNAKYDRMIGYYHSCLVSYSTDYSIRFHSASGGSVSQFLIFLLEKHKIDGAVVVGFTKDDPFTPMSFVAESKSEIISAKSSKYCVVSYEGIISDLLLRSGKYVVVGLPCHIHSFRKAMDVNRLLKEKIIGLFSLFCSSNRTSLSIDYLLYKYKVNKSEVSSFTFRDNGYLGNMVFRDKLDKTIKSVPYQEYWKGMRGFFNVPRCSMCIDHFGELADLSFGDLYAGKYKNEKIGVNSIISRSSFWHDMIMEAQNEGCLYLEPVNVDLLKESQPYALKQKKGKGVAAAMKIRKFLKKEIPDYGIVRYEKIGLMDILKEITKKTMRVIGSHRCSWFILKTIG